MSLRAALASKPTTTGHYDLLVADPTDAQQQLADAVQAERIAKMRDADPAEVEPLTAAVEQARAALAACTYRLTFENLPPHEFEELCGRHLPTKAQAAAGDVFNIATLTPALLAACTLDSDLTEDEWKTELASKRWSSGDLFAVYHAVFDVNSKPRSVTLPKG